MSALLTDLYELTMAQAYYARGMTGPAVFELAVRRLPRNWNFLVCAGVDRVLEFARSLRFTDEDLAYLGSLPQFEPWFVERLRDFRFSGEIWAVAEGTAVFPPAPLLQVAAPLPEAQILETFALNQVSFATLIASKAARAVIAAEGRPVVEFGGRRAHGTDALLLAARSAYIAGFAGTSSVEAGRRYGIPVTGTMGHSYVMAHEDEASAFAAFAEQYPGATLLVDTYDTERGLERVVALARERGAGAAGAVRIDSGEFGFEARRARRMLDEAGLGEVRIIASGGLTEERIAELAGEGAPIDVFAAGTSIVTSRSAPSLDTAYKLVEYEGRDRAKRSAGKASLPGRKALLRLREGGRPVEDQLARFGAGVPAGAESLLRRRSESEGIEAIRERAAREIGALPAALRSMTEAAEPYRVRVSDDLLAAADWAGQVEQGGPSGAG